MRKYLAAAFAALTLLCASAGAQTQPPPNARLAGEYIASRYNWDYGQVKTVNSIAAGTATITLTAPSVTLRDGSTLYPFAVGAPLTIDQGSSVSETVTPTAVSGCVSGAPNATCSITASFASAHGPSAVVTSGTFGLQEAINDAAGLAQSSTVGVSLATNGGIVLVDKSWPGTTTQISGTAAGSVAGGTPTGNVLPMSNVSVMDMRGQVPVVWSPEPSAATALAAPATLVAGTAGIAVNGAGSVAGLYTNANPYHLCIAYVDIMGQEGASSADFSFTPAAGSTNSIGFTAPVASTGAVGYTIYISLPNATYPLAYKVPITSTICNLTTLESTTAACAVANATYGQTGSGAIVSALTVNTSPIDPQVTVISTTSVSVPNAGGRTTYGYVPGSHFALPGIPASELPFTISAAATTTTPAVLGTLNVPPGFMNFVGRTIRICGKATTTASTATIASIKFEWDSIGQNTSGKGVVIGNLGLTPVAAFSTTAVYTFCNDFQTTVAGASATAGSINTVGGFLNTSGVATAAAGQGASSDPSIGATGSLNLASEARINVIYVHTTGTDGAALTLQNLTVTALN